MIYAGLYGIRNKIELPEPSNLNLYKASSKELAKYKRLPQDLRTACEKAYESQFVRQYIPAEILEIYCNNR